MLKTVATILLTSILLISAGDAVVRTSQIASGAAVSAKHINPPVVVAAAESERLEELESKRELITACVVLLDFISVDRHVKSSIECADIVLPDKERPLFLTSRRLLI